MLGQPEQNIRHLFEDARQDQRNFGSNTVDSALLRPGRMEEVIKIELPDAAARSAIFDIHTKALICNAALNEDVNINHIIRRTEGMTGAHMEQIVRLAVQAAMRRDILKRDKFDITEEEAEALEVCHRDFIEALSKITI
ncbi:unnamed protein product [Rotaria sp. Silwood1]|nr:unnamed protein product [Rotaria sp. Silwood1]